MVILLSQLPKCWDYKYVSHLPPQLFWIGGFLGFLRQILGLSIPGWPVDALPLEFSALFTNVRPSPTLPDGSTHNVDADAETQSGLTGGQQHRDIQEASCRGIYYCNYYY